MKRADMYMALGILLFYTALIVCACYLIWGRQVDIVPETYLPQMNQDDGSVVLSREPDAKPTVREPVRPKGHKVVRTIEATVGGVEPVRKPATVSDGEPNTECLSAQDFTCPPVTVRIDLLRAPDGTYRAQASTDKGLVLDGVDIPKEGAIVPKRLPWAIGYQRDLDGVQAVYLTRDIGRIEVGASITQDTAQGRIGWRF